MKPLRRKYARRLEKPPFSGRREAGLTWGNAQRIFYAYPEHLPRRRDTSDLEIFDRSSYTPMRSETPTEWPAHYYPSIFVTREMNNGEVAHGVVVYDAWELYQFYLALPTEGPNTRILNAFGSSYALTVNRALGALYYDGLIDVVDVQANGWEYRYAGGTPVPFDERLWLASARVRRARMRALVAGLSDRYAGLGLMPQNFYRVY